MTMEIKTCEQYVLAQLFDQQDENDMLNRELKHRDERIDELTGQIDAIEAVHGSAMQEAIRKAGRDALMSHCTGYAREVTDGETFEDLVPLRMCASTTCPRASACLRSSRSSSLSFARSTTSRLPRRANDTHL